MSFASNARGELARESCGQICCARSELAAALPGIGPGAVGDEVANGIIGTGLAAIGGEQVLPAKGIVIAIGDGVKGLAEGAGGISIFDAGEASSCQNIAIKEKSAPEGGGK